MKSIKNGLKVERAKFVTLGPMLSVDEEKRWERVLEKFNERLKKVNKQIHHYNLVVPILHKQMVALNIETLSRRVILECTEEFNNNSRLEKSLDKRRENRVNEVVNMDQADIVGVICKKWAGTKNIFKFISSFIK